MLIKLEVCVKFGCHM